VAYLDGKAVATHIVRTPGDAVKLAVALDDMGVPPSDGDLLFLRARLTDAQGTVVPDNGRTVAFRASAGYEIVGADTSSTEAGIASVLVRVKGGKGKASAEAGTLHGSLTNKNR
jgi:beta-galactosidase